MSRVTNGKILLQTLSPNTNIAELCAVLDRLIRLFQNIKAQIGCQTDSVNRPFASRVTGNNVNCVYYDEFHHCCDGGEVIDKALTYN